MSNRTSAAQLKSIWAFIQEVTCKIFRAFKFGSRPFLWVCALLAPFVFAILIQIPLYEFRTLGRLLDRFPMMIGFIILAALIVFPSYVLLSLSKTPRPTRIRDMALFSFLLVIYLPVLYFYEMATACWIFGRCV